MASGHRRRRSNPAFVFGYGSLLRRPSAGDPGPARGVPCFLRGYRRGWDVAMDNRRTIPGYKYYVDANTGERPPVYVTFLNIRPEPGGWLSGIAFRVTNSMLEALDRRERNYERRDVTELVDTDFGGPVWAYVGTASGRGRYVTGRAEGTAVVSDQYVDKVREDFRSFGPEMVAEFEATTDPLDVPVIELRRISVPEASENGGQLGPRRAAVKRGA